MPLPSYSLMTLLQRLTLRLIVPLRIKTGECRNQEMYKPSSAQDQKNPYLISNTEPNFSNVEPDVNLLLTLYE